MEHCQPILESVNQNTDPQTVRAKDIIDASQITKHIFLGSYEGGAKARDGLRVLGITHNLIIGHREMMPIPFPGELEYKFIELPDHHLAKIDDYFDECLAFIDQAVSKNTNILIDCWAGISRSATIVIAYLIKSFCMNYIEAYETVRKARHWINPNKGFRDKLIEWGNKQGHHISEEKILEYEKARNLLVKLYKNELNFQEELEIAEIFAFVFGVYHIHTIDVVDELLLNK